MGGMQFDEPGYDDDSYDPPHVREAKPSRRSSLSALASESDADVSAFREYMELKAENDGDWADYFKP